MLIFTNKFIRSQEDYNRVSDQQKILLMWWGFGVLGFWVYRGLFDFDNFIYFLYTHKFHLEGFYGSQLKTTNYPKLDSESLLPDINLTDWNHYLVFKHRT